MQRLIINQPLVEFVYAETEREVDSYHAFQMRADLAGFIATHPISFLGLGNRTPPSKETCVYITVTDETAVQLRMTWPEDIESVEGLYWDDTEVFHGTVSDD